MVDLLVPPQTVEERERQKGCGNTFTNVQFVNEEFGFVALSITIVNVLR